MAAPLPDILVDLSPFSVEHQGVTFQVDVLRSRKGYKLSAIVQNDNLIGVEVTLPRKVVQEIEREALRSMFENTVKELAEGMWPSLKGNLPRAG